MKSKFLNILLFAFLFLSSNLVFAQSDPILERAKEGIRKHRMGDITIKVTDTNGRPVAGAKVEVEMLRHQFLFGCNIFMWGRFQNPRDDEIYRQRFADLFNYATLPFYWRGYEAERGKPQHEYREKAARWCREHGITAKGHPWSGIIIPPPSRDGCLRILRRSVGSLAPG
jgi:hypothetical protein